MAHTIRDKVKLTNRVKRLLGQVEAIRRSLEDEEDCTTIMQLIAAARGSMNGLMGEVVEGHIREHMIDPDRRPTSREARAAQELIDVIQTYLR
jgi:DNA-binding FrmR family transcriptional regulator